MLTRCIALAAPLFLLYVPASGQDALGDGHALDGNLSTRGTRNTMTSRSRSEAGRFSLNRNPMAGRGYQNAIGYKSNEDFRRADSELTMYADSLYNNPWYWENLGNLSTELITSGGSGGLGRASANSGGGFYNPWFFNADATNASRVDIGRRIGDYGERTDPYDAARGISPGEYDDTEPNDDNRPLVYGIGEPNRFLRDERRGSVLRSSYELRDLDTEPDYVGVGMAPGDLPVRYLASPLQGVFPSNYSMTHSDLGLTQYDAARISEDQRLGRGMPQIGQMWRPDFDSLASIDNRVDTAADGTRLENRSDQTMDDLLAEIAERYKVERGTTSTADLDALEKDYRNVLHEVVSGYGMREASVGLEPASIAGIPGTSAASDPLDEDPLSREPPTLPELGTPPTVEIPGPAAPTLMPIEEFGIVLRHGQMVDMLADDDKTRLSELILAGQDKLASGEYYWAERRFNRALRFVPGHPLATAGLGHAQLGEGLYLTASLSLQSLLGFQPEMIDVVYDDDLLPSPEDLARIISELNMRLLEEDDRARYAFLVAYVGHQMDNADMIRRGLREMRAAEGDNAFIQLLESVWLPDAQPADAGDSQPTPEIIPLERVEESPAAPVEILPGEPVIPDVPQQPAEPGKPAPPPVDLDDLE